MSGFVLSNRRLALELRIPTFQSVRRPSADRRLNQEFIARGCFFKEQAVVEMPILKLHRVFSVP
jgi:hypothetical protein